MEKYIPFLLQLQAQTQLWHWQTNKYAAHVALGSYYEQIQDLTDKFVEVTKGKDPNGSVPSISNFNIQVNGILNVDLAVQYSVWGKQLEEAMMSEEFANHLDIQDILVDMVNSTNRLVYLLRLS